MTTHFEFLHYDVEKTKHDGEFPHPHWQSDKVSLYGCPGVSLSMKVYPLGETTDELGHVSFYATLYCDDPNTTVEVKVTLTIKGVITVGISFATTRKWGSHEGEGRVLFGKACGFSKFCESNNVLQCRDNTLECSVQVTKFTNLQQIIGKAGQLTVITPAGDCRYTHQ